MESKSLIDASDKPLVRRTPPGKSEPEEHWPALSPERRTSTGTLREMLRVSGSQLTQQATAAEKERYPVLGNTVRQAESEDQLPVSRYSATYNISRKQMSTPYIKTRSEECDIIEFNQIRISDPFKDGIYDSGPMRLSKNLVPSPKRPSVGTAVVGKTTQESKLIIEPRQTRTSSLRARLSAGQFDKGGQTKVAGVTNSVPPIEPVQRVAGRDGLQARKEGLHGRSLTPPARKSISKKASRDSIGSNRAPALFVGGSRHPAHPRRPNSRGSMRSESRVPSPPLPPFRPAPSRPVSRFEHDHENIAERGRVVQPRKSSIPLPRMVVELPAPPRDKVATPERKIIACGQARKEARDELGGIYHEDTFSEFVDELQATAPPATTNGQKSQLNPSNHEPSVLESIEESPQHAYRLKRLSVNTPDFGPTLKISSSAERFILGTQEDHGIIKKKSKEVNRSKLSSAANTLPATKKGVERPSSSQEVSHSSSRMGLTDHRMSKRKTKSIDLGEVSPYRARKGFVQPTSDSHYHYPDSSNHVSDVSTRIPNNPFIDASIERQCGLVEPSITPESGGQCGHAMDEATWISPLEKRTSSSTSRSADREILILDEYLPGSIQDQLKTDVKKGMQEDINTNLEAPMKKTSFPNLDPIVKDFGEELVRGKGATAKRAPSTPDQNHGRHVHRSGRHPPRSSSRTIPPEFSDSKGYRSSPSSSGKHATPPGYTETKAFRSGPLFVEKKPPTPPKDASREFNRRQDNLGSQQGHESSQVDVSNSYSKVDSGNRDSTKGDPTKRDLAAHDSQRSQSSMSRGVLSNFRGLFQKRSSDETLKSSKKTKSKVSINANGSPFPPISEIHPIHRPTLASINRANATTPAIKTSATPVTPSLASLPPSEVSTSTILAMQLLEAARTEPSSPRKERLLKLGQFMVDAITQARDAEKAMEEAKQASRKAEVAHVLCKKSLGEVERVVKDHKNEFIEGRGLL